MMLDTSSFIADSKMPKEILNATAEYANALNSVYWVWSWQSKETKEKIGP